MSNHMKVIKTRIYDKSVLFRENNLNECFILKTNPSRWGVGGFLLFFFAISQLKIKVHVSITAYGNYKQISVFLPLFPPFLHKKMFECAFSIITQRTISSSYKSLIVKSKHCLRFCILRCNVLSVFLKSLMFSKITG